MSYHSDAPDFYDQFIEIATAAILETINVDAGTADTAAREILSKLVERYKGTPVYIASGKALQVSERDQQIWNEFTGDPDSARLLASKYNLTLQYIYRVIKRMRALDLARRQRDLFS